MLREELETMVTQIKKQKHKRAALELKPARQSCPALYDTLSSFSNQSGGGIILFGVDEADDDPICGVYDAPDLQKKISEQCLQMEPVLHPLYTVGTVKGKAVVSAEVQELDLSCRPCFYKGAGRINGAYIRIDGENRQMTEYEVYSYEVFCKKIQDELRVVSRAPMEDLETVFFDKYLLNLRKHNPYLADLPKEKILRLQGLATQDAPTLAGILLFADYPQAYFPQLCVMAAVVAGVSADDTGMHGGRFIDNARIEGTLPQMLKQTSQFIRRNMAVHTAINPDSGIADDKTEYPMAAIREIILNALVHRDYSSYMESTPILVVLYRDRLVVESPGGLYGHQTVNTLGTVSADTRNLAISNAMEILNETENWFSGIPVIYNSMQEYGLPAPVFENLRGAFRVTLYNEASADPHSGDKTLDQEILTFCETPRSRKALSARFPTLTQVYLMTRYVNPLVEQGLLELSIPEKPKSKSQRFQTK